MRVLIAGESWMTHSIHVKGFDSFTTARTRRVGPLRKALEATGHPVTYLRTTGPRTSSHYRRRIRRLRRRDPERHRGEHLAAAGSDLLRLERTATARCSCGTSCGLVGAVDGGRLSHFPGIEGKADTRHPVEEVLPVILQSADDRVESPEGSCRRSWRRPTQSCSSCQLAHSWATPRAAQAGAQLLAKMGQDPFIAVMECGKGRSAIFASDCGPHWGHRRSSPGRLSALWDRLVRWLGRAL